MKIAVASQNSTSITTHTGKCQKFWIYNVENNAIISKDLLQLPKQQAFHYSSPQETHPLEDTQVLIGGSMGKGLLRRLENMGIEGVITPETNPDVAIASYLAGTLIIDDPGEHEHQQGEEGNCNCND
ncbi:MAG: nitrogen fixation protein [Gloeocapsa sp. DLM2.Bin57]|nr:MAG: nitrogen fixation protein [Gloeocapsa sp. DLM2.Bin57]